MAASGLQKSNQPSDDLLGFVTQIAGDKLLKVEENLGGGYVRLKISEAERRQAKHDIRSVEDVVVELLRNSRDAGARKVFVAFSKSTQNLRKIVVIDDGCGIPSQYHQKVFEPRVTSKLENIIYDRYGIHGRGMALYAVKLAVDEVRVVTSVPARGSVIKVEVDTTRLPEKKDQSTFPQVKRKGSQVKVVRGPHNVSRFLLEFSLDYPETAIYFGSEAEVFSTIWDLSRRDLSQETPLWLISEDAIHLDANSLSFLAKKTLGLDVSVRNAHRVLSGEIRPLPSLIETIEVDSSKLLTAEMKDKAIARKERGLAQYLSDDDLDKMMRDLDRLFAEIGKRYFLKLEEKPCFKRQDNQVKIILKLAKTDEY